MQRPEVPVPPIIREPRPLCCSRVVGDPVADLLCGFRPDPLACLKAGVEVSALTGLCAQRGWLNAKLGGSSLNLGAKFVGEGSVFHDQNHNVIFHTTQRETSHFPHWNVAAKPDYMDVSETFRANLLRLMAEKGFKAAELSKRAHLNARAVKDIEEGRVASPKLSTVCALANALGEDPAEMMGLGARSRLVPALAAYLAQYDQSEQERLLQALSALPVVRHD